MISIVMVCYNSEKTIKRSIESIIGQDSQEYELIFIDGGSTDGTLDIIASYDISKIVYSKKMMVFMIAMNKGLSVATRQYLLYLNSDDYFTKSNVLSRIQKACLKSPDFIFGDIRYVAGNKVLRRWCSDLSKVSPLYAASRVPHASLTVKRSIMCNLEGFDTKFDFAADFDLIFRLLKSSRDYIYISKELVAMEYGGKTSSGVGCWYKQQFEIYDILVNKHNFGSLNFFYFLINRIIFKIKQFVVTYK